MKPEGCIKWRIAKLKDFEIYRIEVFTPSDWFPKWKPYRECHLGCDCTEWVVPEYKTLEEARQKLRWLEQDRDEKFNRIHKLWKVVR